MLIGHREAWEAWRAALAGGRMHHAWLLTGRAGLGKMTFALAAAHELVGGPAPAQHPDILVLTYGPRTKEDEKKRDDGKAFDLARSIRIGQIREIQRRLTTRPTLGERRAVIIDPVDDLEPPAANALLKSLEEPPVGTYFLLVSHSPARLLATIRSRCRGLRFPALDEAEMDRFLGEHCTGVSADERAAAALASAGSPGAALSFVELGLGRAARVMRTIRDSGDVQFTARGELTGLIGARPERERLRAVLDLARALVAEDIARLPPRLATCRIAAHAGLVRLTGEYLTYNYDAGLFALEIGNLLAGCAAASERADG